MPEKKFGTIPLRGAQQPGCELIYHDTGFIEGTLIIAADQDHADQLYSMLGGPHPFENHAFLYAMRLRDGTSNLTVATFDVAGIQKEFGDSSEKRFSIVPAQELVPIEAHKKFKEVTMAGPESALTGIDGAALTAADQYAEGKNGARFTVAKKKVTGFLGFIGAAATDELRAVRSYQRNNPVLRATWYTFTQPKFQFKAVIISHPKGAPEFTGVKDWLRAAPIGEPVGALKKRVLWKMTEEYIGSETGWSQTTYDKEAE